MVLVGSCMRLDTIGVPSRAHLVALVLLSGVVGCTSPPRGPVTAGTGEQARASQLGASRAESLMRMAENALQAGDAGSAAGLYEQAVLTDRDSVPAVYGFARTLLLLGRFQEAARTFERVMELQPDLPEGRYGYARAMLGLRRPEAALPHLVVALDKRPSDPVLLNALGVTHDLLGQHGEAVAAYRQGLASDPASVALRNNLGLSLALQGDHGAAVATLRPLAEGAGGSRRTRQNLALVHGLAGNMEAAARLSRMDLTEEDVRSNLAYYMTLRGLPNARDRAAALNRTMGEPDLGVPSLDPAPKAPASAPVVTRPGSGPTPLPTVTAPGSGRIPPNIPAAKPVEGGSVPGGASGRP